MSVPRLSPREAKERLDVGLGVLIDIREIDEFAREHIEGALHMPLSKFDDLDHAVMRTRPTIMYICQNGTLCCEHYRRLATAAFRESYVIAGGMSAWKATGLPTTVDRTRPLELRRQVLIAAGLLVLVGLLLALFAWPGFIVVTVLTGCAMVFAGFTGWDGLGALIRRMPWNSSWR